MPDPVAQYLQKYRPQIGAPSSQQSDDDPVKRYLTKYPQQKKALAETTPPTTRASRFATNPQGNWLARHIAVDTAGEREWLERYGGKKLTPGGLTEDEARHAANRKKLGEAAHYVADEVRRGGAEIVAQAREAAHDPKHFAASLASGLFHAVDDPLQTAGKALRYPFTRSEADVTPPSLRDYFFTETPIADAWLKWPRNGR